MIERVVSLTGVSFTRGLLASCRRANQFKKQMPCFEVCSYKTGSAFTYCHLGGVVNMGAGSWKCGGKVTVLDIRAKIMDM